MDCQEISDVGKRRKYHHRWDDVSVLDADHIASWGAYEPGALELVGFDDDKPVPSLTYELQESGDRFRAFYEYKPRDGSDCFPVRSTVYLERRACRFGGHRVYFIAPCCTRRVLRLAALSSGLKCGECGRLTYDTKRKSPAARQVRRANSLAFRLECEDWFKPPPKRPRYMHRRTFNRLNAQHKDAVTSAVARMGPRQASKGPVLFGMKALL